MSETGLPSAAKKSQSATSSKVDRFVSPTAVVLVWVCFSTIFASIQLLSSSTLTNDPAVTLENVQRHFSVGYQIRNPPLFDWLYYVSQTVFSEGIVAHTVLRYTLISAIGILYYAAFRQAGCNSRVAAAFSYSLVFFVWMASDFHYHFTHTLLLVVVGLAAWMCAVAYIVRQRAWLAAVLGLLVGLGMITKWSFLLPTAGAICAFLFMPRARRAFADWRSLLIPMCAAIPVTPVALWLIEVRANMVSAGRDWLVDEPTPYLARIFPAILEYLNSLVLFLLPWPIFIGWIGYVTRNANRRSGAMHPNGRLAAGAALWTIALGLVGVIAVGVGNMGMRYMFPVLLTAPIAAAAWIAPRVDDAAFALGTVRVATVVAIIAIVLRFWSFHIIDGVAPQNNTQRYPYTVLAQELTDRGFSTAQFVTGGQRDAGNLMAHLPESRAYALTSLRVAPMPRDTVEERPCVAIWGGRHKKLGEDLEPPGTPGYFARLAGLDADSIEDIFIDWPSPLYGEDRRSVWRIVPLPETAAPCLVGRGLAP